MLSEIDWDVFCQNDEWFERMTILTQNVFIIYHDNTFFMEQQPFSQNRPAWWTSSIWECSKQRMLAFKHIFEQFLLFLTIINSSWYNNGSFYIIKSKQARQLLRYMFLYRDIKRVLNCQKLKLKLKRWCVYVDKIRTHTFDVLSEHIRGPEAQCWSLRLRIRKSLVGASLSSFVN